MSAVTNFSGAFMNFWQKIGKKLSIHQAKHLSIIDYYLQLKILKIKHFSQKVPSFLHPPSSIISQPGLDTRLKIVFNQ